MSRAQWIKWGLYAASGICGLVAVIVPAAAIPLGGVATFLAGLATRTPGQGPTTSDLRANEKAVTEMLTPPEPDTVPIHPPKVA
jgi:hypothetical protein